MEKAFHTLISGFNPSEGEAWTRIKSHPTEARSERRVSTWGRPCGTGKSRERKYLKRQPPRIPKTNERHKTTDSRSSENLEQENPHHFCVVILNSKRLAFRQTAELSGELCPAIHIPDSLCKKIPALANLCPSGMLDQGKLVKNHSDPSTLKRQLRQNTCRAHSRQKQIKSTKTYPVPPWDRRPTKEIFFLNLRGRSLPMINFKKPVTVIWAQVWLEEPHFKKANKERKV